MLTLHVTRELARALKLPAQSAVQPSAAGSALGPWSLGLVHCRPAKLVVAVSASTRWALAQWALGHDRGVLTHLNQCAGDVLWAANDGLSLVSINQRLAERIIMKPKVGTPAAEVLRVLGGNPDSWAIDCRAEGQAWSETYALMQAQAGQEVVTMPVLRLLRLERLKARHQASMLMDRLPVDERRSLATGRSPRWVPRELVLDLQGIEAVGPAFATTLHAEALALGLRHITLHNALADVAAQLLKIKQRLAPHSGCRSLSNK